VLRLGLLSGVMAAILVIVISAVGGLGARPASRTVAQTASGGATATTVGTRDAAGPGRRPSAIDRAVAWARRQGQRGMHEVGTTNCSAAISRWERHMGLSVPASPPCRPWCGAFIHEAFHQAGIRLSSRIIDPNQSYWDAVNAKNGLKRIRKRDVRAGDLVFFALDVNATGQASHEALVIGTPSGGKVPTAEGNVGHHAVVTRRGLRYVVLAARVTRKPSRS
jgi:hypothetical protein